MQFAPRPSGAVPSQRPVGSWVSFSGPAAPRPSSCPGATFRRLPRPRVSFPPVSCLRVQHACRTAGLLSCLVCPKVAAMREGEGAPGASSPAGSEDSAGPPTGDSLRGICFQRCRSTSHTWWSPPPPPLGPCRNSPEGGSRADAVGQGAGHHLQGPRLPCSGLLRQPLPGVFSAAVLLHVSLSRFPTRSLARKLD